MKRKPKTEPANLVNDADGLRQTENTERSADLPVHPALGGRPESHARDSARLRAHEKQWIAKRTRMSALPQWADGASLSGFTRVIRGLPSIPS
jgi:hypothetical protein